MIEKCSIGNMSYNIQNITLIILILILIIVIIYYLRNSSTKHDELIEKYTTPINTGANFDDSANSIYGSHNSIATSKLHNFPTSGTEVTLRPCQVQFNNTFDASGTGTHTYVYEDEWQEIATLKTSSDTLHQTIEKKIISANNETNKDDKNDSGGDVYTNYSEQLQALHRVLIRSQRACRICRTRPECQRCHQVFCRAPARQYAQASTFCSLGRATHPR